MATEAQDTQVTAQGDGSGVREADEVMLCPACGSTELAGFVPGFWCSLDVDGYTPTPNESIGDQAESSTEINSDRMCTNCEHEWDCEPVE